MTTKTRLASLPDVPTADEAGLKGFEVNVWHGIFAPKYTPAAVVQKLSAALKNALKNPDVMNRFSDINTVPVTDDRATPEALEKLLLSERICHWRFGGGGRGARLFVLGQPAQHDRQAARRGDQEELRAARDSGRPQGIGGDERGRECREG